MRMRRKARLDERVAACREDGRLLVLNVDDRHFQRAVETKDYLDFEKLFGNKNPVVLEIGAGKGQFCCTLAKNFPEINILAIEKSSNVIVDAAEKAISLDLKNCLLVRCDAEYLERYIPEGSVSRIYLNFSCPFPKKSYASHRLTHRRFLEVYKKLLAPGGEIHQKTDNREFFEFSLCEFSQSGYILKNVSLDLHASDFEGNIVTEYEQRFTDMGLPIYRLEAFPG